MVKTKAKNMHIKEVDLLSMLWNGRKIVVVDKIEGGVHISRAAFAGISSSLFGATGNGDSVESARSMAGRNLCGVFAGTMLHTGLLKEFKTSKGVRDATLLDVCKPIFDNALAILEKPEYKCLVDSSRVFANHTEDELNCARAARKEIFTYAKGIFHEYDCVTAARQANMMMPLVTHPPPLQLLPPPPPPMAVPLIEKNNVKNGERHKMQVEEIVNGEEMNAEDESPYPYKLFGFLLALERQFALRPFLYADMCELYHKTFDEDLTSDHLASLLKLQAGAGLRLYDRLCELLEQAQSPAASETNPAMRFRFPTRNISQQESRESPAKQLAWEYAAFKQMYARIGGPPAPLTHSSTPPQATRPRPAMRVIPDDPVIDPEIIDLTADSPVRTLSNTSINDASFAPSRFLNQLLYALEQKHGHQPFHWTDMCSVHEQLFNERLMPWLLTRLVGGEPGDSVRYCLFTLLAGILEEPEPSTYKLDMRFVQRAVKELPGSYTKRSHAERLEGDYAAFKLSQVYNFESAECEEQASCRQEVSSFPTETPSIIGLTNGVFDLELDNPRSPSPSPVKQEEIIDLTDSPTGTPTRDTVVDGIKREGDTFPSMHPFFTALLKMETKYNKIPFYWAELEHEYQKLFDGEKLSPAVLGRLSGGDNELSVREFVRGYVSNILVLKTRSTDNPYIQFRIHLENDNDRPNARVAVEYEAFKMSQDFASPFHIRSPSPVREQSLHIRSPSPERPPPTVPPRYRARPATPPPPPRHTLRSLLDPLSLLALPYPQAPPPPLSQLNLSLAEEMEAVWRGLLPIPSQRVPSLRLAVPPYLLPPPPQLTMRSRADAEKVKRRIVEECGRGNEEKEVGGGSMEQQQSLFGMDARRMAGTPIFCVLHRQTEDWVVQELDGDGEPVQILPNREPVDDSVVVPSCVRDAWLNAASRVHAGITDKEEVDISGLKDCDRSKMKRFFRHRYNRHLELYLSLTIAERIEIERSGGEKSQRHQQWPPLRHPLTHVLFTLRKRDVCADEAARAVRNMASDVNGLAVELMFAGAMESRGVTVQRMAMNNLRVDDLLSLNELGVGISVHDVQHAEGAFKRPATTGRRYTVLIRDVDATSEKQLSRRLREWHQRGFLNYFCPEQFEYGAYSAEAGFCMLRGEWKKAGEALLRGQRGAGFLQPVIDEWKKTGVVRVEEMIVSDEDWATLPGMILNCIHEEASFERWAQLAEEHIDQTIKDSCLDAYLCTLWNRTASTRVDVSGEVAANLIDLYSAELASDGFDWEEDVERVYRAAHQKWEELAARPLFVCPSNVQWTVEWEMERGGGGSGKRRIDGSERRAKKTAMVTLRFDLPANAYGSAALREVVTTVPKEIEYELVEVEDDCVSLIFNMGAVKIETDNDEPQKKVPRI